MDEPRRNAYDDYTKHYDDELWSDLKRINDEVQRRTWARPFEPYANWAHGERLAAMGRFESRHAGQACVPMNEAIMALPPMVEVARTRRPDELRITYAYTAEHMRAYAAEQVAAERERCARLCEAPSNEDLDHNETGSVWDSMACAMAIRRRRA